MTEAFVYCWLDKKTRKRYIGRHTGSPDDGYIGSGKYFREEYDARPKDFERVWILRCTPFKSIEIEYNLLKSVCAGSNTCYYNSNDGNNGLTIHTEESRQKMSDAQKRRSKETQKKMNESLIGRTGSLKGVSGKRHPRYGKQCKWKGVKGSDHPVGNSIWITNGLQNKRIKSVKSIPIGWKKGRTFRTSHINN